MTTKITVYSTDPCSFCVRAKELLKLRKLEFDEVNLAKDPAGRAQLVEETGMLSFPQIVVGEVLLGGFQQLVEADRSGRLAELTAQAA
jgi:glutaredoxin 3